MKRIFTLLFTIILIGNISAQRYLTEMFDVGPVEANIPYATNITVLPALFGMPPAPESLVMDVMSPDGDTEDSRPVIMLLHTGNFLPQFVNGQINGTKSDPYLVSLAERMVKMGYVVVLPDYRLGWNPLPTASQEEKTNTLINASYRGVQDANSCARFLRKSVAENGNPYGIDPDKITVWGAGTGSYIALGAATLDNYLDIVLPKFIGSDVNGDGNPDPMVIPQINGDPFGLDSAAINLPNNPGYSSDFQLCVNLGGALGDTSWLDASDPPMISFHVPTDPFAPYEEDILIVPTTGDLVVEVQGSYLVQQKANALGLNDVFAGVTTGFDDIADSRNDGYEGLFPFPRPLWNTANGPAALEASPWEFWSEAAFTTDPFGQAGLNGPGQPCEGVPIEMCNWHLISLGSNPDMSFEKATAYQDTILAYFAPRAYEALNLEPSATEELLDGQFVNIYPNPAQNFAIVETEGQTIQEATLIDMDGRVIDQYRAVDNTSVKINRPDTQMKMYMLQLRFKEGVTAHKLMFK